MTNCEQWRAAVIKERQRLFAKRRMIPKEEKLLQSLRRHGTGRFTDEDARRFLIENFRDAAYFDDATQVDKRREE